MHSWDMMNSTPGKSMAACCYTTYISYRSACFTHCNKSCFTDITWMIILCKYISNYPIICDGSYSFLLLLLQNPVKAGKEWDGGASRETWAGFLKNSRFEHPPTPSTSLADPYKFLGCTNVFQRQLVPQLWPPSLVPYQSMCSEHTSYTRESDVATTLLLSLLASRPHSLKSHCQELITAPSICINLIKPACCTNCNVGDLRLIRVTTKTVIT